MHDRAYHRPCCSSPSSMMPLAPISEGCLPVRPTSSYATRLTMSDRSETAGRSVPAPDVATWCTLCRRTCLQQGATWPGERDTCTCTWVGNDIKQLQTRPREMKIMMCAQQVAECLMLFHLLPRQCHTADRHACSYSIRCRLRSVWVPDVLHVGLNVGLNGGILHAHLAV
jgi:hypothetical protein